MAYAQRPARSKLHPIPLLTNFKPTTCFVTGLHLHLESCQLNPLHNGVFFLWRFPSFSLPAGEASPFWVKLRALGDIHLLWQYLARLSLVLNLVLL